VGGFGKGVKKVQELYKGAGLRRVKLELIEDGRHEIINEINRQEVFEIIGKWLG
jgi:alpha-beta hydrolase superfamily lysophospholipase